MQIFDSKALVNCIQDVVRKEIQVAIKGLATSSSIKEEDKLLTKKEMAEELLPPDPLPQGVLHPLIENMIISVLPQTVS